MFPWPPRRNFMSFLINPWKFYFLFLQYPWKFPIHPGIKFVTILSKKDWKPDSKFKCFTPPAVSPSTHGKPMVLDLRVNHYYFSHVFRVFLFFHKDQQQCQDHKSSYNLPWLLFPVAHMIYGVAHSGYSPGFV